MDREPNAIVGLITAAIVAVALSITAFIPNWSPEQHNAVMAAVASVAALVAPVAAVFAARFFVFSPARHIKDVRQAYSDGLRDRNEGAAPAGVVATAPPPEPSPGVGDPL